MSNSTYERETDIILNGISLKSAPGWKIDLTLKVKYADFEIITRRRTLSEPIDGFALFWHAALELLEGVDFTRKKIRLMGLTMSNVPETERPKSDQLEFDFGGDISRENDSD